MYVHMLRWHAVLRFVNRNRAQPQLVLSIECDVMEYMNLFTVFLDIALIILFYYVPRWTKRFKMCTPELLQWTIALISRYLLTKFVDFTKIMLPLVIVCQFHHHATTYMISFFSCHRGLIIIKVSYSVTIEG